MFNVPLFLQSLTYMWQGLLGIFAVILILILAIVALNALSGRLESKKNKDE